jgi:hypothetical protein
MYIKELFEFVLSVRQNEIINSFFITFLGGKFQFEAFMVGDKQLLLK